MVRVHARVFQMFPKRRKSSSPLSLTLSPQWGPKTLKCKLSPPENAVHRVVLPFKDQKSADAVRKQLSDLSNKIDHTLQPVFKSRKICEDLGMCEPKPPIISQQCVVYNYKCDLCDAEYVGYTSRHLHQRIDEHRYSAIGKHLKNDHSLETIGDLTKNFSVLKKCNGKLDCLIYEMLFIRRKGHAWTHSQTPYAQNYLFKFVTYIKILSLISNLSLLTCTFFTFYRLSRYILSCKIFILLFSSLENDDMESSKRCVKLISLIFIISVSSQHFCRSLKFFTVWLPNPSQRKLSDVH